MGSAGNISCWSDIHDGSNLVTAMQLNIGSQEAEDLANALATLTGERKTEAVTRALRERLDRVRRARAKPRLADALDEIALHCSTLPTSDSRSADPSLAMTGTDFPVDDVGYPDHPRDTSVGPKSG